MKTARASRLAIEPPKGPADLERLWADAEPLSTAGLPGWLTPAEADGYRRVAVAAAAAEKDVLEAAGLVVDEGGVFVADPTRQPVFAIGLYDGTSPVALSPAVTNPVLTRDDVTDVTAGYVADPFLLCTEDGWHLFFEVWNWRANKGEIGHATSDDGLAWRYDRIVLTEDFHLSYPYVFEWRGERWLCPESFQAGGVRLYRAEQFPDRWVHEATLLEAPYVADPSPFRYGGRWWLLAETSPEHDTLRLFGARDLVGRWSEHPCSPLVAGDPRSSRPAGRVIADSRRPMRFAQDCSRLYGESVRAFEIVELTESVYRERPLSARVLTPAGTGWNAKGMHHVDARRLSGNRRWLAAVDGWSTAAG